MGIDFRGIRMRLLGRLERLKWSAADAKLALVMRAIVKLGAQDKTGAEELEAQVQEIGEKWKSVHQRALFANVGLALSQWAGMEESLVTIACLLLRTHEANKVGTIMYSIVSFPVWLSIINELFSQEPIYISLKPRFNKISHTLRGLKDTRDRLAHHTIYHGDKATYAVGDTSLRPGRFDIRQKSQKYQPLDFDQISKFIVDLEKVQKDLTSLLNAMTDILKHDTSQQKSP